ncbi:MAG: hypothetical protein AAGA39_06555 [Pseudomonadota bacterium]
MKQLFVAATSAIALASGSAFAAVIDFETVAVSGSEIVDGTTITNAAGVSLPFVSSIEVISNGSSSRLITFDTAEEAAAPSTEDPDLITPFADGEFPGDIAIIADDASTPPSDDEAKGGLVEFVFTVPVTMESIKFFDVKEATVKLFSDAAASVQIGTDFVISGLDTNSPTNPGGGNLSEVLDLMDTAGVLSLQIVLNESGGFDDITFQPIPVPGALPLMIGGAALLGAAGRRRRQR